MAYVKTQGEQRGAGAWRGRVPFCRPTMLSNLPKNTWEEPGCEPQDRSWVHTTFTEVSLLYDNLCPLSGCDKLTCPCSPL